MPDAAIERRIAEVLTRDRSSGLCPLDGPCASCDCFDPLHEYDRANAKAVMAEVVTPELGRLRNSITALEANGSELLARGERLAAERCPSCDHLAVHHQPEGCWYAITTGEPGRDLVCPCIVPYAPESNADAPTPVTAATEAHGETTEAQEGSR